MRVVVKGDPLMGMSELPLDAEWIDINVIQASIEEKVSFIGDCFFCFFWRPCERA